MVSQNYPEARMDQKRSESSKLRKGLFVVAGSIFLALGCVGIVLPILPTTPFLLLSAACYYKGSERMHRWMLNNRWFGNYIKNYKEGKGLSLKAKVLTLALLWIVISYSALFVVNVLIIQVILFAIAVGVSLHIVTLPTFKKGS
jgi:uncharacterized membrane protein YbaN (DUF454 family)